MRVVDVPLAPEGGRMIGIAGYAIDIQELESERGAHRRFVDTQRELLDRLSAAVAQFAPDQALAFANLPFRRLRSDEHTSELQSLMRISYAVFCLKKQNTTHLTPTIIQHNNTRTAN